MTPSSAAQPISQQSHRPKREVPSVVLSALLATQVLIADARAEPSPSDLPAAASERVDKKKTRALSTDRQSGGCWERRLVAGRWKRTNVCFTGRN